MYPNATYLQVEVQLINVFNISYRTSCAIIFAICGPSIPGSVPAVFVIPINTPANLGAMSMWLMENPAREIPPNPTPMVRNVTASSLVFPR